MTHHQKLICALGAFISLTGFCHDDALAVVRSAYQSYDHGSQDETTPTLLGLKLHDDITKNNAVIVESLLTTDMKENKFPEINHWLLAKLALKKKRYGDVRKHVLLAKALPFLKSTKLARELYDALPQKERSWLVEQMIGAGYFDMPPQSSCPYFELQKRKDRAEFLYAIVKAHALHDTVKKNIFNELYLVMPEAVDITQLEGLSGFTEFAKTTSTNDVIKRMEHLLTFGKNSEARASFAHKTQQKKPPLTTQELCDLDYVDAKVDRKLRKFDAARSRFKALQAGCGDDVAQKARYLDLSLAAQRGDVTALADFDVFVDRYPEHSFADDVLLFKANLLLDKRRDADAITTLNRIIESYPHGDMIERALFLKAYQLAKQGRTSDAIVSLEQLQKIAVPTDLHHSQARYWIARLKIFSDLYVSTTPAKEHLSTAKTALYELVRLPSPNVYSWLAYGLLTHLGEKVVIDVAPKAVKREDREIIVADLVRVENLVKRGFRSEALAMLEDISVDKNVEGLVVRMAQLYDALNQPWAGHQKLIRCDYRVATILKAEAPETFRAISYPRPFKSEVSFATSKVDVPEEIIFSVMRQESGFIKESTSWAGAKGLMQLMYPSALGQAKLWGITDLREDDLYVPDVNILLASSLLQGYWQQFGSIVVGLAAYNAGPNMAKAWLTKNKGGMLDTFVEDIGFKETRDYVKSVLGIITANIFFNQDKTSIGLSFKRIASIK